MKKYFPIPQLSGVVKDYHQRMVPDNKCSDCLNVMFKKGHIVNRWGYGQFGQQLEGAVTEIAYYERLRTRQNDIVAFTASDTYKYNKATGLWEYITRSYNTGTVSTSGNTITLSGGTFPALTGRTDLQLGFLSDMNRVESDPIGDTGYAIPTGTWRSICRGDGLYVACSSEGYIITSPDGTTWTSRTTPEANQFINVCYGDGLYVAVSFNGTYRVMTSPNGITWTSRTAAEANQWVSVCYGDGLYVAVAYNGTNRIMTSPDGETWTARSGAGTNRLTSVCYGDGLYVAVGVDGHFFTSPDGTTWTDRTVSTTAVSVCYGDGLYVAVGMSGTDRVTTSPDGTTWTARTSPTSDWSSVSYGNGLYLAVAGNSGTLTYGAMTSPDGITWTARTAPLTCQWVSVCYYNGLFLAIAMSGTQRLFVFQTLESYGWFTVGYTDSTHLTGTDLPEMTDSPYVLRIPWQGSERDHHSVAFPYYDDGATWGDNILMVSNGVDIPQWWNGTGVMQEVYRSFSTTADYANGVYILTDMPIADVSNIAVGDSVTGDHMPASGTVVAILSTTSIQISGTTTDTGTDATVTITGVQPNPAKNISFFGSVGFEHTILANTVDAVYENIQTLEYSRAGNPFMWEGNSDDLLDSNDEILGIVPLETRLIVYKRYNLSVLMPNLNPTANDFFIINENAKRNIGTTSIRTVKNLGNYHIFMGWDDIYIYDGINVTGIGNDIINYLISNMNRSAMENSFAIDIDEEKLYCLFVPIGQDQENPNYCFCFNYQEKHWTIWQLADEMTAYGFFAKDVDVPTYGDLIVFTTGTLGTGTQVTVASSAEVEVGMSVFAYSGTDLLSYNTTYFPTTEGDVRKVISVDDATHITLTDAPLATGSIIPLKIGWAYEDLSQRYRDMIVRANFNSYLVGDSAGNIYEISPDFFDDNGTDIQAFIETGDYDVNDPRHTFRLNETILGFIRQDEGYFKIYVSPDMGAHWSDPQLIPMFEEWINGGAENDYIEYLNNWTWRGTMMRIKVVNRDAVNYYCPFEIESLLLGYTEDGGVRR